LGSALKSDRGVAVALFHDLRVEWVPVFACGETGMTWGGV